MNDGSATGQCRSIPNLCSGQCANYQRSPPISNDECMMQHANSLQKRGAFVGYLVALRPVFSMLSSLYGFIKYSSDFNFLHGCCVGQAANPGPWSLQVQNIVSAAKHVDDSSFQQNCIVWSETTANEFTQQRVQRRARACKASAVFSAPIPSRRSPGKGGRDQASGTTVFAKTPMQCLSQGWEAAIFSSARVADAVLHTGAQQIRVIAVYGYHSGNRDSLQKNEHLFSHVFARASQFHLPTIVAGDFNCDISMLSVWSKAQALGYVDIAARQAAINNCQPEPTYRGTSRLDYVICNALAARAFQSLVVDPKGFTDHAVLDAVFHWEVTLPSIPSWKMPFDFGKCTALHQLVQTTAPDENHVEAFSAALNHGSLDVAIQAFSRHFEEKIARVHLEHLGRPLHPNFLGRLQGKFLQRKPQQVLVSKDTGTCTDRELLKHRLRTLHSIRELLYWLRRDPDSARAKQNWLRVLKAKGFAPNFATWLLDNDIAQHVPLSVPPLDWLLHVMEQLQACARHWDRVVQSQKQQSIAAVFQEDWKQGGSLHAKLIKDQGSKTLDGLLNEERLEVRLRRAHKTSPAVFTVKNPEKVSVGSIWHFGKISGTVVQLQGNKVRLDRPATIEMTRAVVVQKSWCAQTSFVAARVQQYWDGFWNAKQSLDPHVVHCLLQCAPQLETFDATISLSEVQFAIHHLKQNKARGMDGWSNMELKLLHDGEVQMLTDFFNAVGRYESWPDSMSSAWVSLLAKVPQPLQPSDGRPITVLPTLYRLWSKITARKVFATILPVLPPDLYGSVPGKSTLDAAWELQSTLEEAMCVHEPLVGVTLDLSKAYNTLPRPFLQQLARKCGWPDSLINTYMSFLKSLKRFFRVHDGLHAETMSTVGVPEGCPLAVPMMIMLTMTVTNFIQEQGGRFISFVDNWTMLSPDVPQMHQFLSQIKWATDGLCLLLNPGKTAAFATTAENRTLLRKLSFAECKLNVAHATHDLGVAFTSTKRITSGSIATRLEANVPKLERLQAFPWKTHQKVQMINRSIAPSILYGCAMASTSATMLSHIRKRFNSAVWGKRSHRNHFLAPLLGAQDVYEPFHWFFSARLQGFRRAASQQPQATTRRWNLAIQEARASGPTRYFLEFIAMIKWEAQPNFLVTTLTGTVNLLTDNLQQILQLMRQDWWLHVSDKLSDKEAWSGMHWIDWHFTGKMRRACKFHATLAGNFTTGAAIFSDQKKHFLAEEEDIHCVHCGAVDSQAHRLFDCPFYEHCRRGLPIEALRALPELQVQRGLFRKPHAIQVWENITANLSPPNFYQEFDDHVHIFTDGSTLTPQTVPCSSWAVVLADPCNMDATVVESGWLHGKQDNYRAERCAVWVAVQHCQLATLYIDNEAVVFGLRRLQLYGWQSFHWQRHPNRDLWWKLWGDWRDKQPQLWTVNHVHSHQDISRAKTWHHAWRVYHNGVADAAAGDKNRNRPAVHFQALALARMEFARVQRQAVQIFQLQQNVLSAVKKLPESLPIQILAHHRTWECAFQVAPYQVQADAAMLCPRFLGVLAGFCSGKWVRCQPPMSLLELYINFVSATGWLVPINIASWPQSAVPIAWRANVPAAWIHETSYPDLKAARQPLTKQVITFQHCLKKVLKTMEVPAELHKASVLRMYGRKETAQSTSFVPEYCTTVPDLFHKLVQGKTLPRLCSTVFEPLRNPPVDCQIAQLSPTMLWNKYFRQR